VVIRVTKTKPETKTKAKTKTKTKTKINPYIVLPKGRFCSVQYMHKFRSIDHYTSSLSCKGKGKGKDTGKGSG
jgi:hypothetical protein